MTYTILKATEADAVELGPRLRANDKREIEAILGPVCPTHALIVSVGGATEAWTGRADGEIICMWGVNPTTLIGLTGVPWMLGSELVAQHWRVFLRENKRWVAHALRLFPILWNLVDARYAEAIAWLRWLGFAIGEPAATGYEGALLRPFEMRA